MASRLSWTLSFVAFFILLMAIVNFVNISIGSSSARMKEIGVRKVLGGSRKQLIFQFLTESIILVSFSTILALVLYPMLQPLFEKMVGKSIPALNDFPRYYILIPAMIVPSSTGSRSPTISVVWTKPAIACRSKRLAHQLSAVR